MISDDELLIIKDINAKRRMRLERGMSDPLEVVYDHIKRFGEFDAEEYYLKLQQALNYDGPERRRGDKKI